MDNDPNASVRERLKVLAHGPAEVPDVERALRNIRARAAAQPSPARPTWWSPLRWAAAMIAVCLAVFAAIAVPARGQRAAIVYSSELEQLLVQIHQNGSETILGRNWIRMRSDGAYETTQTLHLLSFITKTRVVYPDGRAEKFFDVFPISVDDDPEAPIESRVAAGCVLHQKSSERVAGREVVHGLQTVLTHSSVSGGRILSWRAPALGCQEVRLRVEAVQPDGSLRPVFEKRTILVKGL